MLEAVREDAGLWNRRGYYCPYRTRGTNERRNGERNSVAQQRRVCVRTSRPSFNTPLVRDIWAVLRRIRCQHRPLLERLHLESTAASWPRLRAKQRPVGGDPPGDESGEEPRAHGMPLKRLDRQEAPGGHFTGAPLRCGRARKVHRPPCWSNSRDGGAGAGASRFLSGSAGQRNPAGSELPVAVWVDPAQGRKELRRDRGHRRIDRAG